MMDATADAAYPKIRFRKGLRLCSVCETPGTENPGRAFRIPTDENRYKKWFLALQWNVPPEKLKYVLVNARVCDRHFSESCFSTVTKLAKLSLPITEYLKLSISTDSSSLSRSSRYIFAKVEAFSLKILLSRVVLSHSVASALNLCVGTQRIESNARNTARYIKKMDVLFDAVNCRTLKHHKRELGSVRKNSCHEKTWKEMIPWIETWQIRSHKGKHINADCKNGWILTLKVFLGISQDFLQTNKFMLTNRFNHDATENTFSSIRRRGGFRDNPDTYEFRHTIQKVIITNFFKESSGKNCQYDEAHTLIDFRVYAPSWFRIKVHHSIKDGARHLWHFISSSRYLPKKYRDIIEPVISHNAYLAAPENMLLAMLTDERCHIKILAAWRIIKAKEIGPDGNCVRRFVIPALNFRATDYVDVIDWQACNVTPSTVLRHVSYHELLKMIQDDVQMEGKDFIKFPSHTQAVERIVNLVTETSRKRVGPQNRDGFIRVTLESRKQMSQFESKKDYKK
ncbi:hypothetical protein AVEN_204083-1 [Araneus ventricosus]|uniref:THAP-type domain-containing protein n=1 Tax=Araneus ventricosus TaxID=182803 RepID=A0A4Y2NTM7_ARAVE|nr:hypothetical protein AVEN_204083-1 [Araneus ventricosus]